MSSMPRHALGVAPFENGDRWLKENLPSANYADSVKH